LLRAPAAAAKIYPAVFGQEIADGGGLCSPQLLADRRQPLSAPPVFLPFSDIEGLQRPDSTTPDPRQKTSRPSYSKAAYGKKCEDV
jgi:hypothetical protein